MPPKKSVTGLDFANLAEIFTANPQVNEIVGIDEVGRGCWAGPLLFCASVFSKISLSSLPINNVTDSKLLNAKQRKVVYDSFHKSFTVDKDYFLEQHSAEYISQWGLAHTIHLALKNLIDRFDPVNTFFLLDGGLIPPAGINVSVTIKGDRTYYPIALAAILAKVTRDSYMTETAAKEFPKYGFEKHKGYGTTLHLENLKQHGICKEHRTNYAPIKEFLYNQRSL